MAITFTGLDWTGTVDEPDTRAAVKIIEVENARRARDLDENGDPILPPLPYATNAEKKASYITILLEIVQQAHNDYIEQDSRESLKEMKSLWDGATDAERAAARTALGG